VEQDESAGVRYSATQRITKVNHSPYPCPCEITSKRLDLTVMYS